MVCDGIGWYWNSEGRADVCGGCDGNGQLAAPDVRSDLDVEDTF